MTVEFALRPRIRLREDFSATPRRRRVRLPKLALPVLAYWLTIGAITYAFTHAPVAPAPSASEDGPSAPDEQQTPRPEAALQLAAATAPGTPPPALLASPRQEATRAAPAMSAPQNQADNEPPMVVEAPRVESDALPAAQLERGRSERQNGSSLPSCEAAAAAASQDLDFASSDRTADLSSSSISAVLNDGAWLSACQVPGSTSLDICVAIQGGRVTASTVVSQPVDSALNACLKQRAAALQFPYSTRVDIARTRF